MATTWNGMIKIPSGTNVKFYATNKAGTSIDKKLFDFDVYNNGNTTIITITEPISMIVQNGKKYIKCVQAVQNAFSTANSAITSAIKNNSPCYMLLTSTMTKAGTAGTTRTSVTESVNKSQDGNLQLTKGKAISTVNAPQNNNYQNGGITPTKTTKISVKGATYKLYNGDKYILINKSIYDELQKAKCTGSYTIGSWFRVDGSSAKITDSNQDNRTHYQKLVDNDAVGKGDQTDDSSGDELSSITSATVDIENGATAVNLTTNSTLGDLMSDSMQGIFGIPYQWMSIADRRISGSDFGRKYAEKIAARMPLLFLTPCRPAFLSGATKDQKNNVLSALFKGDKDVTSDLMDTLLGDTSDGISRYYTTNFAYEEYFRYVDVCCQTTAKLLNLDGSKGSPTHTYGIKIGGKERKDLSKFNWSKSLKKNFSDYFSSANSIPFYINANVSVSESISNDTMESSLAGTVKSKGEQAKELNFLLNTASSASSGGISTITNALTSITSKLSQNASAANFITSVGNSMSSIAAGGSMMFPELWSSSSMGRSYQVDIKLRSPDGDALSVYMNVLVPLYHLLCLAAPQMMNDNYNIYYSPFLVKAYCKSMFNIDMGIITSMDINKGKEGDWNANGIPTSIDVSITIKDLYDVFSLTPYESKISLKNPVLDTLGVGKGSGAKRIVRNTAMMDYLCNNAGLNLNQNEISRQATVYKMLRINNITNWPNNKWLELQEKVDNTLAKIYRASANNRK